MILVRIELALQFLPVVHAIAGAVLLLHRHAVKSPASRQRQRLHHFRARAVQETRRIRPVRRRSRLRGALHLVAYAGHCAPADFDSPAVSEHAVHPQRLQRRLRIGPRPSPAAANFSRHTSPTPSLSKSTTAPTGAVTARHASTMAAQAAREIFMAAETWVEWFRVEIHVGGGGAELTPMRLGCGNARLIRCRTTAIFAPMPPANKQPVRGGNMRFAFGPKRRLIPDTPMPQSALP